MRYSTLLNRHSLFLCFSDIYFREEVRKMNKTIKYKKQIIFLFAALAMISYVSLKTITPKEEKNLMVIADQNDHNIQVYLMDQDRSLVPLSIAIDSQLELDDKLKQMVEYMSTKHESFQPVFKNGTQLKKVEVKDGTAILTFNEKFKSYRKENELRTLEAITWGATQFEEINNVEIKVGSTLLTSMPLADTPIPTPLNRTIGINNFESTGVFLHDSKALTVFYTKMIDEKLYYVPKTKRIENNVVTLQENVQQVLDDVSASSGLSQPLYVQNVKMVAEPYLEDGTLIVSLNENILSQDRVAKEEAYETLILSLSEMMGVDKIKVVVDDVVISLHGSNEDAVSVNSLSYNRVKY